MLHLALPFFAFGLATAAPSYGHGSHYGYGQQVWDLADPKAPDNALWVIVDRVRAPAAKGDYVLRWRWDAEQTSQVWSSCADITVV